MGPSWRVFSNAAFWKLHPLFIRTPFAGRIRPARGVSWQMTKISGYYSRKHDIPAGFSGWPELCQAQYWEVVTFLSPYLLSSQGDRMAMAHSVEGRYPFLDYRVIEFCNRLPVHLKMPGLTEKFILKQLGRKYPPAEIWQRVKRPYRAPIQHSFLNPYPPEYVNELLSEHELHTSALFEPQAVRLLVEKASSQMGLSEVEDMALVGILSTQLVDQMFVQKQTRFQRPSTPHLKLVEQGMEV